MFSPLVLAHWLPDPLRGSSQDGTVVVVDPGLHADRPISLLRRAHGPSVLSLTPPWAEELRLRDGEWVDAPRVATRLAAAGITLNSPDHVFYLPLEEQVELRDGGDDPRTRLLTAADAEAFREFTSAAPEEDLAEAFVELDHWLVVGAFAEDRLVAASSMYPWHGTELADVGVITLPGFRGRGLGRATVRAISAAALRRGYEPQYRCQVDNLGSAALARAAGFTLFGDWEVVVDPA